MFYHSYVSTLLKNMPSGMSKKIRKTGTEWNALASSVCSQRYYIGQKHIHFYE